MAAEQRQIHRRVALTGVGRDHFNTLRIPAGSLVLITDLPTYELEPVGNKTARIDSFTLEATDGSYKRTLIAKDDNLGRERWVDLVFEDLPTRKRYILKATLHGENETVVFQDMPYADLSRISTDLEKKTDKSNR